MVIATQHTTGARYASVQQHDVSRCERGLSAVLGAACPCQGRLFGAQRGNSPAFFESLPESDPHSFKTLPGCEARLIKPKRYEGVSRGPQGPGAPYLSGGGQIVNNQSVGVSHH